jgi:Bacterial Ig-like domain (group 1)
MPTAALTPPGKRRSLPFRPTLIPLGALILAGCGGDLVLPDETGPASLIAIGGESQSGTIGLPLVDSVRVRVTDRKGEPVKGVRVAFVPAAGAGSASPDTTATNADGRAKASWTLGTTSGPQSLSAVIPGQEDDSALTTAFTATALPGAATSIALSSGDNQSAAIGTQLPDPLVVIVTDGFGNPVEGVEVIWAVQEAGGVDPATAATGPDGLASTQRTLGPVVGTQHTTASSSGLEGSPIAFTHTATKGGAAALQLVSGNDQTGVPGAELTDPLVVRLVDVGGNPIAGSAVSWVIGVGGGSVVPSGDTDADGMASARFTLGPVAGTNTVNAVVSGVGVVTFTANKGGGGGSDDVNSTVSASPTTIQALTGSSTITVTVRDGNLAPVSGATVQLSAPGSGNSLTQPSGTTGADGVTIGSFSSSVPGTKVVSATVNGTVHVVQTAVVVVTVAQATTLEIVAGDGQMGSPGSPVAVRPSVKVTNDAGQGVAGFGVTFVVTGGNGSVTGASQTTNSSGVATVGSWVLGDPGTNTLEARATGLNGSPAVFTATAVPTGGRLIFRVQPAAQQTRDRGFTPPVEVAIVDGAGSVVSLSGVSIRLSLAPQNGQLRGHENRDTDNGVAVFDDLSVHKDGSGYVLTASAPSRGDLGEATSDPFDVNK